jgi:hypothetical protein
MQKFGKRNGGGRRCAAREAAPMTAVFTTVTYSRSAVLVDMSCTGARLRSDFLPSKGEELMLSVEQLRIFGMTVWSERGECGVRFDLALAPLDVHDIRRRAREGAGLTPELKGALDDWTVGLAR